MARKELLELFILSLLLFSCFAQESNEINEEDIEFQENEDVDGFGFGEEPQFDEDSFNGFGGGLDDNMFSDFDFDSFSPEMLQQLSGGFGGEQFEADTSQLKYLTCDVCKLLVEQSFKVVGKLREDNPNRKFSEIEIDELLDGICDPKAEEGEWISSYEIVEVAHPNVEKNKATFEVKESQDGQGYCMDDCYTIEQKCVSLYGEVGPDLVAQLWSNKKSLEELLVTTCTDLMKRTKGSCGRKRLYFKKPADSTVESKEEL